MRKSLARGLLEVFGWKVVGKAPEERRYVLVAAPHTSYWDAVVMLLLATALGVSMRWVVKYEACRPPHGWFLRAMGALPIRRDGSQGLVGQVVREFERRRNLVLAIAPSGARRRTSGWRSGFYVIARAAAVPVVPGFIDYGTRRGGLGEPVHLTGNVDADMSRFREFYEGMRGLHPEQQTPVMLDADRKASARRESPGRGPGL